VLVAVFQSVKWQEMEKAVGDDNQALAQAVLAKRRDQLVVERFQVALRGSQERIFKPADVFAAHAELGQLKAQQLENMSDPREHGHGENADFLARNNGSDEAVACREIFDQGCARRERGLQLFDGKIRGSFQRRVFALTRGKFTQGSQQFFFVALRFFLEGIEALAGVFLGAKLLEFDTPLRLATYQCRDFGLGIRDIHGVQLVPPSSLWNARP